MNAQLISYVFEGKPVRVTLWNGDPWFVLVDVAGIFEIENPRNIAARLGDHQKGVHTMDTLGGPQQITIITEGGLYKVAFQSRKAIAERFTNWVVDDVLPSIRKTGSYHADGRADFLSAVEKLVEPIKGRFAEHDQQLTDHDDRLDDHEDRLGAVEGKIVHLGDWKRRNFSAKDLRRLARFIDTCYGGKDPVTGLHQITNGHGHFLPGTQIDHFNNLRRDNRIENALPMHASTHRRKTGGENFLPAFNEFQRKRLEFERHPGPLFDDKKG